MTSQFQDAVWDQVTENVRRWTDANFQWLRPSHRVRAIQETSQSIQSWMQILPGLSQAAPMTPFNMALTSTRQFVWADFPFTAIRAIRSGLGGTVHDVALTIIAGGLGRHLRMQQYTTANKVLRTMCPVSMRQEDEQGSLGNRVSMMLAPLFIDEADPLARYDAQRAAVDQIKKTESGQTLLRSLESVPVDPASLATYCWPAADGVYPFEYRHDQCPGTTNPPLSGRP